GSEIDGPVQRFGNSFWNFVLGRDSLAAELIKNGTDRIVAISYSDRYLSNPISVALLIQIIKGLKALAGPRWDVNSATISVLKKANRFDDQRRPKELGHDWLETTDRSDVIKLAFQSLGLQAGVYVLDRISQIEHGRPLRIKLSSKKTIEIRFDQGMGHWRIPQATNFQVKRFDFNLSARDQFARLKTIDNLVEGQQAATQIFLSVREDG